MKVPKGWKLVPIKPTPAMCDAGEGYHLRCGCPDCDLSWHAKVAAGYKAMLDAAPKPPSARDSRHA